MPPTDESPVGSTEFAKVPPSELADNPRNPPRRIDDLDDLANVAEYGLLQPILVATRQNFLRSNPALAPDIGDAPYVIMAGHRRKAAALKFGLEEVPVHIRHDLSANGGDAIVRLLENLNRKALDPISEALEYERLRDENGMGVRQIAERLHIKSHAVVSKRLKLLTLPTALQEAIADTKLGVTDAESLCKLENGELQMRAWELMENRGMRVGQAIAAARRPQQPREGADRGHRRGPDGPTRSATNTAEASAQASQSDAASAAAEARYRACVRLAQQLSRTEEKIEVVARYAIHNNTSYRDAVRLAHSLLRKAGIGPVEVTEPTAYLAAAADVTDAVHLAFMIAVASDEARIRDPRRSWDRRDVAHLHRLEAAGHVLTEWERLRSTEVE